MNTDSDFISTTYGDRPNAVDMPNKESDDEHTLGAPYFPYHHTYYTQEGDQAGIHIGAPATTSTYISNHVTCQRQIPSQPRLNHHSRETSLSVVRQRKRSRVLKTRGSRLSFKAQT